MRRSVVHLLQRFAGATRANSTSGFPPSVSTSCHQLISLQQFILWRQFIVPSGPRLYSADVIVDSAVGLMAAQHAEDSDSDSESEVPDVLSDPAVEANLRVPEIDFTEIKSTRSTSLEPGEVFREDILCGGKQMALETGKLACLADGSAVAQSGDTHVLVSAVCDAGRTYHKALNNMPLTVDYRERLYAIGKIPMTYTRREGAPKDREVLCSRTIERAIRPLFPPGFNYDSQICANVLSAGGDIDPVVLSINAASVALICSDIPWEGPVAAVQVALVNGVLVVNPTLAEAQEAEFCILSACTRERTVMLEAHGNEVSERRFLQAVRLAHREAKKLLPHQISLAKRCHRMKRDAKLLVADPSASRTVMQICGSPIQKLFRMHELSKVDRAFWINEIKQQVMQELKTKGYFRVDPIRLPGSGCASPTDINCTFEAVQEAVVKQMVLEENLRVDGRGLINLRPIYCEVNSVPVVHGSCLFQRGETQSLCSVTVGGTDEQQRLDSLLGETRKQLMVHYAFPPFANTQTGRTHQPNRRELGHSNLVEKALRPVMPAREMFPFSVRLNAETLMSNGSSSMAAVCGGALALHDAGIPIKSLVAGVSIGVVLERQETEDTRSATEAKKTASQAVKDRPILRYELLTDLQELEDQYGDMDFKIAGTRSGITAAQLDVKSGGVSIDILEAALTRAKAARSNIIDIMTKAMPQDRGNEAPKFDTIEIERESVFRIIGPSGETAKKIEADTGARLDIQESGQIRVFAPTSAQYEAAEKIISNMAGLNIKEGYTYQIKVVRLMDYGAFVQFESGMQALLHISEISHQKVRSVDEVLREGQEFEVLCLGRDTRGNIRISRKALLPPPTGMHSPGLGRHKVTLGAPHPRAHDHTSHDHTGV